MNEMPDMMSDLHQTARQWFAIKQVKGLVAERIIGGELDGLDYYPIELDGVHHWLTEVGLFTPPSCLRP